VLGQANTVRVAVQINLDQRENGYSCVTRNIAAHRIYFSPFFELKNFFTSPVPILKLLKLVSVSTFGYSHVSLSFGIIRSINMLILVVYLCIAFHNRALLYLFSPTRGGHSVGILRSRTRAMELFVVVVVVFIYLMTLGVCSAGARGSVVGWGTMWARVSVRSLIFFLFNSPNLSSRTKPWGILSH
jgi:hypothetical protein